MDWNRRIKIEEVSFRIVAGLWITMSNPKDCVCVCECVGVGCYHLTPQPSRGSLKAATWRI